VRLKLPVVELDAWKVCRVELLVTVWVVKFVCPAPGERILRAETRIKARIG
jgi:predicted RNA-binding Zn-ribbon protein involved in translation (DUF1610 family)